MFADGLILDNNITTMPDTQLEISFSTLVKTLLFVVALILLYLIRDVLFIVFLALIIAAAVQPLARRLQHIHFPRVAAVLTVYLFAIISISGLLVLIITPLTQELRNLALSLPQFTERFTAQFEALNNFLSAAPSSELQRALFSLSDRLSDFGGGIFSLTTKAIGGVTSAVLVFVISFYLALDDAGIKKFLQIITPASQRSRVVQIWLHSQRKLGRWLGAQLLLALIIGVMTYIGLLILNLPFALSLALLAALFEIIPYVGPVLAAIPALILAFFISPLTALLVLALYVAIQQLEAHLLVPNIMRRAVGLNPVIAIIALLIGFKLGGLAGMIVAIPVTMLLAEVFKVGLDHGLFTSPVHGRPN